MKLRLFGPFSLSTSAGDPLRIKLRRAQGLLAFLALREFHRDSREVLIDLLWPDRFRKQAQASLRQVLFDLRAAGGSDGPLVEADRDSVALGAGIIECDVWRFEGLAASPGIEAAEAMLSLYQAPLLNSPSISAEPFEQWLAIQRARLEGALEKAVLAATIAPGGDIQRQRAVAALVRLVDRCPLCCDALLRAMNLEADAGRTSEARHLYERHAVRMKIEFDDVPPGELQDAYHALGASGQPATVQAASARQAAAVESPWPRASGDAPVVAVLPFRYEGSDTAGRGLTFALSEDITLMLSGCRWFSVLSRSATQAAGQGPHAPLNDFAKRTGSDYLIFGTLARRSESYSLTVELADARNGKIRWIKRYDAEDANVMPWASDVCPQIVAALDPAIAESECNALRKPALSGTGSPAAYRHLVSGYLHYYAGNWSGACDAFQTAIAEDATYAHAHAMLAVTIYLSGQINRNGRWSELLRATEQSAARALEIDPAEAKACNIMAQALDWQGRHDESIPYHARALDSNPSFALASTALSYHAVMTGELDNAKAFLQTAMRLRVGDRGLGLCLPSKALADLLQGNLKEALATAHWAVRLQPRFWLGRQILAACLGATGALKDARRVTAELRSDYPDLDAEAFVAWFPYADPKSGAPVLQALKRSGWS